MRDFRRLVQRVNSWCRNFSCLIDSGPQTLAMGQSLLSWVAWEIVLNLFGWRGVALLARLSTHVQILLSEDTLFLYVFGKYLAWCEAANLGSLQTRGRRYVLWALNKSLSFRPLRKSFLLAILTALSVVENLGARKRAKTTIHGSSWLLRVAHLIKVHQRHCLTLWKRLFTKVLQRVDLLERCLHRSTWWASQDWHWS